MAGTRTVKVRFDGDAKGLQRAANDGQRALSRWSAGAVARGAAAGIMFDRLARAALQFGKDSISAFAEAEEAQTKLSDAFARFPRLADTNIDRLRKLNTTLATKTKFDDDAFASGQAVLAQFKLTGRQIEGLTPLLADYAAKTGQSIPDAAKTLGKSFLGNTKALKTLGINYKSTGNQAKDVENITRLLRAQVGGFAEKQGKTASGQAAILSNRFGELKESLGAKLLPVLMKATEWGLKVAGWIERNQDVLLPLIVTIGVITAAQIAWNIAMSLNPIGLIIIGIAALVTAILYLATKTRFFQTVWGASWGAIKGAALAVGRWFHDELWGHWILGSYNAILNFGGRVLGWFQALPGRLRSGLVNVAEIITAPFRAAFNAIARFWNNTAGRLSFSVPSWVPGIGGNGFSMPQLPVLHRGGIVPGDGDVPIVARGGEGVFTREQMEAMGGPRVIENHIHIGDEVVRVVRTEIRNDKRSTRRAALAGAGAM